jgi:hypothetical protein
MPEPETEFHKGERPIKSEILIKTPDVNMNCFQDENFGRRTVKALVWRLGSKANCN